MWPLTVGNQRRNSTKLPGVLVAVNTLAGAAAAADVSSIEKHFGVEWLGVYMQGQKTGYGKLLTEKSTHRGVPTYRFLMNVMMRVNLLGTTQETSVQEDKHFSRSGKLISFATQMHSKVRGVTVTSTNVSGVVTGNSMTVTTVSGSAKTTKTLPAPKETLDDYLAANRLAEQDSKVGDTIEVSVFEGTFLKSLDAVLKVVAKKKILFNGIETDVTEIETLIPDLGITTTSFVNREGRMLETKIAGMFVLRAENESQAKDVDCAFDAIRMSVIAVDKPIANSHEVKRMTAELRGISNPDLILDTSRYKYVQLGTGRYRLQTQVEDVSGLAPLALPVTDARFAEDLESTALLQCDHPKIVAKAKEIVGTTKHAWPAAKRLSSWVWASVDKVGTAALSNAVETLESKRGDCTEHTALFVALARAVGIPARPCTGLVYWARGGGFGYHQWASIYVGKWVEIDPTFNQPVADGTHIKFAEGDWSEAARIISLIGTLKIKVLRTE